MRARSAALAEAAARWRLSRQCHPHPQQHRLAGSTGQQSPAAFGGAPPSLPHHHQRQARRAVAASSSSSSASPPALTEQSPFWTLCGVVAVGISAAAVGQRAAVEDERAARAELRNAAAEAYAAERRGADALEQQLAAVERAARRAAAEQGTGGRRRPWREVSEELWAAMSDRGREDR